MDAAVILIPPCLCDCHILKVQCQNPGCKKLPVSNLTALLTEELFDFFMIHSCQRVDLLPFVLYRLPAFRCEDGFQYGTD